MDNGFNTDLNIDFNDFDFEDSFEVDSNFETRYIKPKKIKDRESCHIKYQNAEKLAKDIKISKGERYFVIVDGSFIYGDFIEAFVIENKLHVKSMTISTLSFSQDNIDSLANLLNWEYCDELNLIVSSYFFSHEKRTLIPYAYKTLDKKNKFQLAVSDFHTKICIFETINNEFFVIHGSANLRSCDAIEQICIEENKELYDFNNEIHNTVIEKYKTINKPVRRAQLKELFKK